MKKLDLYRLNVLFIFQRFSDVLRGYKLSIGVKRVNEQKGYRNSFIKQIYQGSYFFQSICRSSTFNLIQISGSNFGRFTSFLIKLTKTKLIEFMCYYLKPRMLKVRTLAFVPKPRFKNELKYIFRTTWFSRFS